MRAFKTDRLLEIRTELSSYMDLLGAKRVKKMPPDLWPSISWSDDL